MGDACKQTSGGGIHAQLTAIVESIIRSTYFLGLLNRPHDTQGIECVTCTAGNSTSWLD